ncbi:RNA polymerase II accessory factor, Cdc73 [Sarocladium implicatum]|nr:RNA polymerase II accessory factor, Cdc73 [Sarocladium implicatum]
MQMLSRVKRGLECRFGLRERDGKGIYHAGLAGDSDNPDLTIQGTQAFLSTQFISRTGTWYSDAQGTERIKRKLFGKAPWHRKDSSQSYNTISSSLRDVLRGQTPSGTPHGSLRSVNSQFPGGEAVRISTPPLDEDTADGRPRGFFTCATPPALDGAVKARPQVCTSKSSHSLALPANNAYRWSLTGQSQPREWWEHVPKKPVRRNPAHSVRGQQLFEFDVQEHLPNSPLCPTNSRHVGGGAGVCVYHGRRRTEPTGGTECSAGSSGT